MQPKFQTSFIPKKQIGGKESDFSSSVHETDIVSLAANLIAIATLLLFGGLFLYKNILIKQISIADSEINAARSAIQPEVIKELVDANSRISTSIGLLDKHIATSNLMNILGDLALRKFKFNDFTYTSKNGIPSITAQGEVQSYNALAKQQEVFSKSEYLKNPNFYNISLGDTGNVKFNLTATVNFNAVSYKKVLESPRTN